MLPLHMGITLVYHVLFVKIADYTIVILKLAKSALLYCEIVQQDWFWGVNKISALLDIDQ